MPLQHPSNSQMAIVRFIYATHLAFTQAARGLVRDWQFASSSVLILMLAIGTVTAVFAVVDGVVLRPLPFPSDRQLVSIESVSRSTHATATRSLSYAQCTDVAEQVDAFDAVAAYAPVGAVQTSDGKELPAAYAAPGIFSLLGTTARVGRFPDGREALGGAERVAVITYGAWIRLYGRAASAVGARLRHRTAAGTEVPVTIIGVADASFVFPYPRQIPEIEAWLPLTAEAAMEPGAVPRSTFRWQVVARLKKHISISVAQKQLDLLGSRLRLAYPSTDGDRDFRVTSLRDEVVGDAGRLLLLFLAAVSMLVLVACFNIACVMLARASASEKEFGIRVALGASRVRIVGHVMAESALLCVAGGMFGWLVSWWLLRTFLSIAPRIPRMEDVVLSCRVTGFSVCVIFLSTLVSGLAPALRLWRGQVARVVAVTGPQNADRRTHRLRATVVVMQAAVAILLQIGAGLALVSYLRLLHFDLGTDVESVVAVEFSPSLMRGASQKGVLEEEQRQRVAVLSSEARQRSQRDDAIVRALSEVAGVRAAAVVNNYPLSGLSGGTPVFADDPARLQRAATLCEVRRVTSDYFRTLGLRLEAGRLFAANDRDGTPLVAIVNRTMARGLWGGTDPVGREVYVGRRGPFRVVGVIHDVRHSGARKPALCEVYLPDAQDPKGTVVVLKASGTLAIGDVRRAIEQQGGTVLQVRRLNQLLEEQLAGPRFGACVFLTLSVVTTVLALAGIHGLLTYVVALRRHEIGIRLALGAQPAVVIRSLFVTAGRYSLAGMLLGLCAALLCRRLVEHMLFDVAPADPYILGTACATFLVTVAVAAYRPARLAARIDPAAMLRRE